MFAEDENITENQVMSQLKSLEKDIVRTAILKEKKRIDGRGLADVRQIKCEVGVLPRTHGSALFTRGETQALVVTTLGMTDDEQRLESLRACRDQTLCCIIIFHHFQLENVEELELAEEK